MKLLIIGGSRSLPQGVPLPQTHLEDGLRRHIAWLDAKGDD